MFHSFRRSWVISFYPLFSYSVHFMAVSSITILFTTTGLPAVSFLFLPLQFNSILIIFHLCSIRCFLLAIT